MAITSQTLIPTSTSALSYSTPTNDPDGSNGGSLITSGGSPPLIVAFLAIGLFIVSMLGVFAWRRITQSRRARLQPIATNSQKNPPTPSERPILCDVWVDPRVQEKSVNGMVRWEDMTPVAALLTLSRPPPPVEKRDRHIGAVIPSGRVLFRAVGCLVSTVRRNCVAVSPPPQLPAVRDKKEVGSPALDGIALDDASSVQASVIITMPCQGRRREAEEEGEEGAGRTGTALGEFYIGTTEVPWSDCG